MPISRAPQGQPQQQEERPTLGPRTGPALESGPLTSTTTDLRKLMRIRTLYIESIDNSLSDKLVEALGKWGRFRLVTKAKGCRRNTPGIVPGIAPAEARALRGFYF